MLHNVQVYKEMAAVKVTVKAVQWDLTVCGSLLSSLPLSNLIGMLANGERPR